MIGQKGIQLNIGDKVQFRSKGMISPDAVYEGEVIGAYKYFYEVLGAPIKSTLKIRNDAAFDKPKPYKFCIPKYIDTRWERVRIVEGISYDQEAEARAG